MSPVVTSGLAATQLNANFGKVPGKQPHVIDLIKECYEFNGRGEISDDLCKVIDDLVEKAASHCEQKPDEIKRTIVEIIKNTKPEPASASTASTALSVLSPALASTPEPVATVPGALLAASKASTEPATQRKRLNVDFVNKLLKKNEVLNALQEVEAKQGVPEKLIQYKKELESTKRQALLEQQIGEATANIESLPDLDTLQNALVHTESSVKLLVKIASSEKKSLVDNLRKTDLTNREQDKSVADRRIQHSTIEAFAAGRKPESSTEASVHPEKSSVRKIETHWSNRVRDQKAKHEAAVPGFKKLQSQLAASVNNIVIPVLEPQAELNAAKLNALAERVNAFEKLEKEKLPDLESKRNDAKKTGDVKELESLLGQTTACEKNIKTIENQKREIARLQRMVSAAGVDLIAIRELNLQFGIARNKANVLPFNLDMLGNGVESPSVNDGFSLNQALEYGRSGRSNDVISRSVAVRTHLAEFGSNFNAYEHSKDPTVDTVRGDRRSFLSELGGTLRAAGSERTNKVLDFLSTKEGRKYIHRLSACNVTAAGFNAETLQLDAPSLAYKVESGFSPLKKFMVGRAGVYARDPGEYVGKRLSFLSHLSTILQKEIFREAQPVTLEHVVITPQHAVEASSLILAALPNDLLVGNHVEVTRFMKSLKQYEGEIQLSEKNKQPVSAEKQLLFKQVLIEFHNNAASWVAKREAGGADKSISVARNNSAEIAANGRKGIFRRASTSVGHFINLAGGTAIREGWSSLQNYLSNISQKERLRQQFDRPENLVLIADLKRQLQPLTQSKNMTDVSNAQALIKYLGGKSLTVEMKGELSPQLKRILVSTGNFLNTAWEPLSKERPMPNVIGLSSVQTNSIPNYATTHLSKFAVNTSSEAPLKPVVPSSVPLVRTASVPPAGAPPVASSNQWISNLWGGVLNEGSKNPTQQLTKLKTEYLEAFLVNYPEGSSAFSDQQVKAYFKDLESLNEIAVFANRNVNDIPARILEKMKELAPTLLNIRRGAALQNQLTPLGARTLQNVSGDKARCWLRSSWGAAVNALPKDEFMARVGLVAQSMNDELGSRNLTFTEIGQIYDQIKADPLNGLQTKPDLEYKQRALMISLMDRADDGSWKKGNTLATLNQLKKGENPQTEGDFGVLFFKALELPLIIHNGSDTVPDLYLPDNYKVEQHGHPDTWPTLRYDGTGDKGHWQFYEKAAVA
ncbi:hypothetical protein [Limnobacter sp. 130]|uniref:hypothetical protein n=1 Tax=Limnobacter sp. 130 TaxID=2653147 RepID=UPI001359E93A|nr:hypothetical protein [Limnobacter sp. 130]